MSRWNLHLFGGLSLESDGNTIDQFPTKRSATILARLATSRNGSVSRDELAEELWPEDYLDTTRMRLRQELSRLRAALGDAKDVVDADRTWVRLDLDKVLVDSREFERLVLLAQTAEDASRRRELLETACHLYRGPLLPELSEHWVFAARMDLREKLEKSLDSLMSDATARSDNDGAASWAMRALRLNSANESAVIVLAKAQQALGDVAGAQKTLEDYERANPTSPALASIKRELRSVSSAPLEMPAASSSVAQQEVEVDTLPTYFDRFVGREHEFEMLLDLLGPQDSARCVTVVGPGGVGKTRLATEVGHQLQAAGASVRYVSLEALTGENLSRRLADQVAPGESCLLMLDNAESDIEASAASVAQLLKTRPDAKVLCTSRQRMAIAGERAVTLEPIEIPIATDEFDRFMHSPSVQLFVDRARINDPKFAVKPEEAVDLAALISRLEGLPLAIELAAAKVATVGLREMASRLDDLYTMLVTRRRDIPARQRSIYATIEWSYSGLDEELQDAMRTIAACPGGLSSEMARGLLGATAPELMDDLRDRSLLAASRSEDGAVRYRLMDSIRAYVHEKAGPEGMDAKSGALARVLAARCQELWGYFNGPRESEAFTELGAEFENILGALEWATSHDRDAALGIAACTWRYWCYVGHRREGHAAITKLLSLPDNPPTYHLAHALFGAGFTAHLMGMNQEAEKWFDMSHSAHLACGRADRATWVTLNMTCIADEYGDYPRMYALAEETFPKFQEMESNIGMALSQADMAIASAQMGEFERAGSHMEKSIHYRTLIDSPTENGRAFFDKGRIEYEKGELAEACRILGESMPLFDSAKQPGLLFDALRHRCEAKYELGDLDAAKHDVAASEKITAKLGHVRDEPWFDRMRGFIAVRESDWESAKTRARSALEDSIREDFVHGMVDGVFLAVAVLNGLGQRDAANSLADELRSTAEAKGYWFRPSRKRWMTDWPVVIPAEPNPSWQGVASKALEKMY